MNFKNIVWFIKAIIVIIIIIIIIMMMMMIMTIIIIIIIITIILIIGKGKINSLKPISPQSLNNAKFSLFITKRIFCLDKPEDENI